MTFSIYGPWGSKSWRLVVGESSKMGKTNKGSIWAVFSFWRWKEKDNIFQKVSWCCQFFFGLYWKLEITQKSRHGFVIRLCHSWGSKEGATGAGAAEKEECHREQRPIDPDYLLFFTTHPRKINSSHYRDAYYQTSTMECNKGFESLLIR